MFWKFLVSFRMWSTDSFGGVKFFLVFNASFDNGSLEFQLFESLNPMKGSFRGLEDNVGVQGVQMVLIRLRGTLIATNRMVSVWIRWWFEWIKKQLENCLSRWCWRNEWNGSYTTVFLSNQRHSSMYENHSTLLMAMETPIVDTVLWNVRESSGFTEGSRSSPRFIRSNDQTADGYFYFVIRYSDKMKFYQSFRFFVLLPWKVESPCKRP